MRLRATYGALTGLTLGLAACSTTTPATQTSNISKNAQSKPHQLAPVKLATGECGLFVWTGQDRKFRFYSQGRDNIRLSKESGAVFLQRDTSEPSVPDIFGQYPNSRFLDAEGKSYSLSFLDVDTIGESIRYSKGSLRSTDNNGWERMEAAFGVSTCLPGEGLPIENSLSASRFDLIRPLSKQARQNVQTAQITMTPASLKRETTKVLSVPAVTTIERPAEYALPPAAPIQRASFETAMDVEPTEPIGETTVTESSPYYVQLASYLSEERAQRAWSDLSAQHAILSGNQHEVVAAQIPDKGLYFRLQIGGYETQSVAAHYCETLKGEGLDCFVALRKF